MAKGHRSQIKRERNANKDTRPSAKLSYARVSVTKACFVLDAIRGKDLETAPVSYTHLRPDRLQSIPRRLSASGWQAFWERWRRHLAVFCRRASW